MDIDKLIKQLQYIKKEYGTKEIGIRMGDSCTKNIQFNTVMDKEVTFIIPSGENPF